jgi:murein DD-endopeptidase MepM/ murein hydrolase activator NlpD
MARRSLAVTTGLLAFLIARALLVLVPVAAAFIIVTALLSGAIESDRVRFGLGLVTCVLLPLVIHSRVPWRLAAPRVGWFTAGFDALLALALAFGFADDVGRALRRHGDWFVGDRFGAVARAYRGTVGFAAAYLERFDPPPDLAPVVIPPDPHKIPFGPFRPGESPMEAQPTVLAWFHPLGGPRRAMPLTESRRFGAARPQPRPAECELGHCGVDLGTTLGEPVFATFEGVIERIERDEAQGGRAGRYVRIGHQDGRLVTRYIHLDTVRDDLKVGQHVHGGELIGRVGATGIEHSGPHLHFALSRRENGRETYLDPEPLLRTWQLPDAKSAMVAMR